MQKAELRCYVNVATTTPGNSRKHWAVEMNEAKEQRSLAKMAVKMAALQVGYMPEFPVRVTLVRFAARKMDRHNLPGAMKHIIDGVADIYGVDDGDPRWQFAFDQVQVGGRVKSVGVIIQSI